MRASDFEARHPNLIRQLLIAAAFASYLLDPVDVAWRFIQYRPNSRFLEHACFLLAALLIGAGAVMSTRAHAFSRSPTLFAKELTNSRSSSRFNRYQQDLDDWFFALGLATLVPLAGSILLVVGESIRVIRLIRRSDSPAQQQLLQPMNSAADAFTPSKPHWGVAFRHEAARWGLVLTMIVFTVTLIDRLAEILAGLGVLIWILLNLPTWIRRASTQTELHD